MRRSKTRYGNIFGVFLMKLSYGFFFIQVLQKMMITEKEDYWNCEAISSSDFPRVSGRKTNSKIATTAVNSAKSQ